MKHRKKWLIPVGVVGCLLLLCAAGLWYMAANTLGFSVGRCLVADNGSYMLIEGNSPIVLNTRDKRDIFTGLETGDKILVLHYGVEDSYPGQTGVKWVLKLGSGTLTDIPEHVITKLTESGWLSSANPATPSSATISSHEELYVGVSRTSSTYAHQDEWGVKLTAKDITSTGLTLVCQQQGGEAAGELQTGSPYALEKRVDGAWVDVELLPMEGELSWTMEAWSIPMDNETEWVVNWQRLYGELAPGTYRICKSIMNYRAPGDYDERTFYAGFDILDTSIVSEITYEYGGYGVSIPYLSGWEYEVREYAEDCTSYGVSFRPVGEDGWIHYHYWYGFGVCGTGLKTKDFGNGTMGTYDNNKIWSYISFPAVEGNYVATTDIVGSWWDVHGDVAMQLLAQASNLQTIIC